MSTSTNALQTFFRIVEQHQTQQREHPTDDFGYPICACPDCEIRTLRMSGVFIDKLLRNATDPERTLDRNPQNEFDRDGDDGREHQDYLRDNGSIVAGRVFIDQPLPRVSSPSIVPGEGET